MIKRILASLVMIVFAVVSACGIGTLHANATESTEKTESLVSTEAGVNSVTAISTENNKTQSTELTTEIVTESTEKTSGSTENITSEVATTQTTTTQATTAVTTTVTEKTTTATVKPSTRTEATTSVTTQSAVKVEATTEKPAKPKVYKKPGKPKVKGLYTKNKVKLTWKKVKRAKVYFVYRKNKKGKFVKIGSTKKLTFYDKKAVRGKTYAYKVMAGYYTDTQKLIKGEKSAVCEVLVDTIDPNKKMVALTFDDGPGPYTNEIVACLKRYDSKATFFVVGNRVNSQKDAVKEAFDIGCEIGNHSYDHSDLSKLTVKQIEEQMARTDANVKAITGCDTTVMRTPYGSTGQVVRSSVGKPIILWSIDTLDWKTRSTEKTINSVMNNVRDGSVVLMHDIHEPTKNAALSIIPRLRERGYQLVTVSELAKYRGYELKKGNVYYSFYGN